MRDFFTRPLTLPVWAVVLIVVVAIGLGGAGGASDKAENVAAVDTTTTTEAVEETTTTAERVTTSTAPATTAAPTTTKAPVVKTWQEVASASGSADKRTANFRLGGGEKRMRYTSKAGIIAIYIMKAGESLQESGGFPEVTCTDPCGDETRLANPAGEYYLDVSASGGTWSVVIEEMR